VASKSYETAEFLTLDEGLRSGDVVVTEAGQARGLIRHRPGDRQIIHPVSRREVNRLVLVNNSKRPLLLLAGEIVTGGKQDRVIGKDRIVPAESDPVDLSVFASSPDAGWRRTASTNSVRAALGAYVSAAVFCCARECAQARWRAKNQQQVWDSVGKSKQAMAASVEVNLAAARSERDHLLCPRDG
jgi:hypothetical protein